MSAIVLSARAIPRLDRATLASLPALLLVLVLCVGPLLLMATYSLLRAAPHGGVIWEFSLEAYRLLAFRRDIFSGELVPSADHLVIVARSTVFAVATTLLCILIGFPTALHMASRPVAARKWWILAITIPFWTSLLVRTLALMLIIGDQGIVNGGLMALGLIDAPLPLLYTDFAVMLGLVYSSLPFMVLPVFARLEKLDPKLVDAASDLYAGRRAILTDVILPIARPGILAGSVLVFVPALGSYVVPLLLGGGRSMMIGDLIALQFGSSRNWPLGAAESVVLILCVALAFGMHRKLAGRQA